MSLDESQSCSRKKELGDWSDKEIDEADLGAQIDQQWLHKKIGESAWIKQIS